MKVTILDCQEGQEEEIIVRCHALDDRLVNLVNSFKTGKDKLVFHRDDNMVLIDQEEIFYIESIQTSNQTRHMIRIVMTAD